MKLKIKEVANKSFKDIESADDVESMQISVPSLIKDVANLLSDRYLDIRRNGQELYKFGIMVDELRQHIENHLKENPAPVEDEEEYEELNETKKTTSLGKSRFKKLNRIGKYSMIK
jgi:hypothetical protein